ncbi:MAG: exodeoxyribonuclease VII large subunit [Nitrospinota bacterium]
MEQIGLKLDQNKASRMQKIYTVTELTSLLKNQLEDDYSSILVKGELSGFKRHSSGHIYFSIKDENMALLSAIMWRSKATKLDFQPKDGDSIVAKGKLSFYQPQGKCHLITDHIKLDGIGELYLKFEKLKESLKKEGLFDDSRKKSIPSYPTSIGIVTSADGAALKDIVKTIRRRFPGMETVLAAAKVQGENAVSDIIDNLELLDKSGEVDLIILARGGGSIEDLMAFNDEKLARVISQLKLPIISAVGHETDFTIADFVADCRASTPTAGAELATPDKSSLIKDIEQLAITLENLLNAKVETLYQDLDYNSDRVTNSIESYMKLKRNKLESINSNFIAISPIAKLKAKIATTAHFEHRLNSKIEHIVFNSKNRFEQLQESFDRFKIQLIPYRMRESLERLESQIERTLLTRLELKRNRLKSAIELFKALNPKVIVKRGYAIIQNRQGNLIKSIFDAKIDEQLDIMVSDGILKAKIFRIISKK